MEFFLPDKLVKQLISDYSSTDVSQNKGLLFTVDFEQDETTYMYCAAGTVAVAAGNLNNSNGAPIVEGTMQTLCPHPPPCG